MRSQASFLAKGGERFHPPSRVKSCAGGRSARLRGPVSGQRGFEDASKPDGPARRAAGPVPRHHAAGPDHPNESAAGPILPALLQDLVALFRHRPRRAPHFARSTRRAICAVGRTVHTVRSADAPFQAPRAARNEQSDAELRCGSHPNLPTALAIIARCFKRAPPREETPVMSRHGHRRRKEDGAHSTGGEASLTNRADLARTRRSSESSRKSHEI